jgi:predicted negative regulator of RcsB-dependent stress response
MSSDYEKCKKLLEQKLMDRQGEKYCFIGAGLSANSDIPTWDILCNEMQSLMLKKLPNKDSMIDEFNRYFEMKDYPKACEAFTGSSISYNDKQLFFTNLLLKDKIPHKVHFALLRMGFNAILTTNFDHLLEDAYASLKGRSLLPILPNSWQYNEKFLFPNNFFLAKVHGDAAQWTSIVLDSKSYDSAEWGDSLINFLARDNVSIFVLGYGGNDFLVNKFLVNLSVRNGKIPIIIIMTPTAKSEYYKSLNNIVKKPDNFDIIGIEKQEITNLLLSFNSNFNNSNVIDCPWGEMPPSSPGLYFGDSNQELRNFFRSDKSSLFVYANKGQGLSSFLAQGIRELSEDDSMTIYRLEGKMWLPKDAYISFLLSNLDSECYKYYIKMRCEETDAWNEEKEGKALATSLSIRKRKFVILIEHADRLFGAMQTDFLDSFIKNIKSNTQIVISSSADNWQNRNKFTDSVIKLDPIDSNCFESLMKNRKIDLSIISDCMKINKYANFNTIVLANSLISCYGIKFQDIKNQIEKDEHGELCKQILQKNDKDKDFIKVIEICSLFSTPRTEDDIEKCINIEIKGKLKEILCKACDLGLLITPIGNTGKYAMSTTIREDLIKCFPNSNIDYLNRVGDIYDKKAKNLLSANPKDVNHKYICNVIPYIVIALKFYKDSKNFKKYCDLILSTKEILSSHYCYNLVKEWLSNKEVQNGIKSLPRNIRFDIYKHRYKIARDEYKPIEYKSNLDKCYKLLTIGRNHQSLNDDEKDKLRELEYELGIYETMERSYKTALNKFDKISAPLNKDRSELNLNIHLRIAQTFLTLGQLDRAERKLHEIEKIIDYAPLVSYVKGNYLAMLNRHQTTLFILKIAFSDCNNSQKDVELFKRKAEDYANKCLDYSKKAQQDNYQDETNIGIAYLKHAQLYHVLNDYQKSNTYANNAIECFSACPNTAWWRMTAHDLSARSFAQTGEFEKAELQLKLAHNILNQSRGDKFRKCELLFTRGLIYLQQNKINEAEAAFSESVQEELDSPCIMRLNLSHLALAQIKNRKIEAAKKTLSKLNCYKIITK